MKEKKTKIKKSVDIIKFFQSHGAEIWLSRLKAELIHPNNISSSGQEIEKSVRNILRKLLPSKYYIGHGHIIDELGNISPQVDIIISDALNSSIYFQGLDGTDFIPFESVYAYGEVKTSFCEKAIKNIGKFIDDIKLINTLKRNKVLPNEFDGFNLGSALRSSDQRAYKNPLFKFMIFVDGKDVEKEAEKFELQFNSEEITNLPNVITILNEGILANFCFDKSTRNISSINSVTDFLLKEDTIWCYRKTSKENTLGQNLLGFLSILNTHLLHCTLSKPNLLNYLQKFEIFERNATIFLEYK